MKARNILIFLLLISIFLCGCNAADTAPVDDVIAVSGDLAYYAAMGESDQKDHLLNRHIEITGTVSGDGITTIFIGEEKKDGISFSCTFPANTSALEKISVGSSVRLHGICTNIIGNCIYLDRCVLSQPPHATTETVSPDTSAPAASTTVTTTPSTTVPPTAVPPTTVPPTTIPPATVPATAHSTPAPTEPVGGIFFVKWPETISRNETAEVTIQGNPNTQYTITVYYKSGPSTAKGLEPKTSDSEGYVTWTWKVGGKTSPGTFRITVSGGGKQNTVNFTIKTNQSQEGASL